MATKNWKEKNKDRMREYRRRWYAKNKEHAKTKVSERRLRLKTWFKEYKSNLKCNGCTESHISCLVFHHKDPSVKEMTINEAMRNGWSKKRTLEEIGKCEVLCANCHCKHHYLEGE